MSSHKPETPPILLLAFNRPDKVSQVMEKIRKAAPSKIFIAVDGPRDHKPMDKELCEETSRRALEEIDWDCEVNTLFRKHNLGCKKAVSSAVTWFFEQVEEGIILEDDCLPSDSFFGYCAIMLEKYRYDERVGEVSGHNSLGRWHYMDASYHFSKTGSCWGWASWRRAWKDFDVNMSIWKEINEKGWLFDRVKLFDEAVYHTATFNSVYEGKLDSWAYIWNLYKLTNSYMCIVPSVNLIKNIGFGGESTHTESESQTPEFRFDIYDFDLDNIVHPPVIMVDEKFDEEVFNQVTMFNRKFTLTEKIKLNVKKLMRIH